MAVIQQKTSRQLVISAFPKCIFSLATLLLVVVLVYGLTRTTEVKWQDYGIFIAVCLVFMAIQKVRTTTFDKGLGKVFWKSVSVFGVKTLEFRLADIDEIEMVYGKGQYARGGAIYLTVGTNNIAIADSDICIGNRKRNVRLKEEIAQWL